jgi:hypothetical protein
MAATAVQVVILEQEAPVPPHILLGAALVVQVPVEAAEAELPEDNLAMLATVVV